MPLGKKELAWVAHLARLELTDEMAGQMADQLSSILDYIEKLNELDTSDVAPMSHPGSLTNVFRDDEPTGSLPRDQALKNAPDRHEGFFRVPRVIE